jgi:O-methyltransferase
MTTAEFIKTVGFHSLGGPESKEATYDIAMLALQRGIPGDFVECGVYAGASSALMARALQDHYAWPEGWTEPETLWQRPHRRVHLFDSFEGMPEAHPIDAEIYGVNGDVSGAACVSLPTVQANMQRWGIPPELLAWHPGWFEQTIPHAARFILPTQLKTIAVLRLDADLYSSTQVAMKHLYPLVSPGGWIICDDYDLSGARLAVNEVVNPAPMYWRKR